MPKKAEAGKKRVASSTSTVHTPPCSDMDEEDKYASGVEGNENEGANVNVSEAQKSKDDEEGIKGFSPAGRRKKNFICAGGVKTCGQRIAANMDSIRCDACGSWFHPRCQGLKQDAFNAVVKHELTWLCITCKPNLLTYVEMGKQIDSSLKESEERIMKALGELKDSHIREELGKRMNCMEEKVVSKINEQQAHMESTLEKQTRVVEAVPKVTTELRHSAEELKKFMSDSKDKEIREKNIILHNIPESQADDPNERKKYDVEMFEKVASTLVGNQCSVEFDKIIRLGKKTEKLGDDRMIDKPRPRLLLVKMKDPESVNLLIRRRTQLRNEGFPNVYLTRDLTPEERSLQKKLKEELERKGKSTHVIFRGRVIPRRQEDITKQ